MKSKIVWISIFLLILGCVIAGIVWALWPGKNIISHQEETKALQSLLGRTAHLTPIIQPTRWTTFQSNTVTFLYPSWATINTQTVSKDKSTYVFVFSLLTEHIQVAIQILPFTGSLQEYPGVNLRLLQKDTYTPIPNPSTLPGLAFANLQDTIEKTDFLLYHNTLMSVGVTGYDQTTVDTIFNRLVASVKIK